jgi:hypothetical protein
MTANKETVKRINWPPRMTVKRKRARALMQEWADKGVELDYSARAGVTFTGTISALNFDDRGTSFLFRNDFGVHAMLSTDLYDRIEITEIPSLPINVGFYRKDDPFGDGFSIRPSDERARPKKDLQKVYELFRQWERLDTMLMVNTGDGMRITVARGKVKELSDRFMFTIADTQTVHLVVPDGCTWAHIEAKGDQLTVMLYNDKSGLHLAVTNGLESPEDVINRFVAQTTRLQ